ncbi:hypothetical protein ACFV1W_22370 [Kitasatospora sp. NPDC059648]|uniref:hypothetical protein n=1 Tax=Kitasatospora sp. NPDC059648 TaxID=3346894 RepID=UPI00367839AF
MSQTIPIRALLIPCRSRNWAARSAPPTSNLVLQAPAPVVARALGYHDKTTTQLVTEAGGAWSRYAPGSC